MFPSPPETRESLLVRLKDAADSAAWQEVMDLFGPLIYRVARARGLQPADAEDVVQSVFMAVTKQIDGWLSLERRGRFRAWIQSIARNIAINTLTRRPIGMTQELQDSPTAIQHASSNDQKFDVHFDLEYRRELFRWAGDSVREEFSERTWLAFELSHIQGHSIADVAQQLGMTEGSVYIARSRIVARLRQWVQRYEEWS